MRSPGAAGRSREVETTSTSLPEEASEDSALLGAAAAAAFFDFGFLAASGLGALASSGPPPRSLAHGASEG